MTRFGDSLVVARASVSRFRRWVIAAVGTRTRISIRAKFWISILIFAVSFSIKSLVAVDLSPVIHTAEQPAAGMASEYDARAVSIVAGNGILVPHDQDRSDTRLLVHTPGYSTFLGAVYSLFGRSYFKVQVIQNAVNSLSPVLIFLIAGLVLGPRIGAVAGLLAAGSHHLSYYSNFILPDSLCALPVLVAVYLLARAGRSPRATESFAVAGLFIGISIWLRPNALALGPILAAILIVIASRPRRLAKRCLLLAFLSILAVAPITVRNHLIYGEFVLLTSSFGIVLWEGIGESGGTQFGAVQNDNEVAEQEARWYHEPAYANTWQTPDGIQRDRARIKRSIGVILSHPFWYAGTVTRRMGEMFKYSAQAPLIFRGSDTQLIHAGEVTGEKITRKLDKGKSLDATEQPDIAPGQSLAFGKLLHPARPLARLLQRTIKETLLFFIPIGVLTVCGLSWRRFLFISMVPLYYLLAQSTMHTEFRYTLPMHYFMFVFAAAGWVLAGASVLSACRKVIKMSMKTTNASESTPSPRR